MNSAIEAVIKVLLVSGLPFLAFALVSRESRGRYAVLAAMLFAGALTLIAPQLGDAVAEAGGALAWVALGTAVVFAVGKARAAGYVGQPTVFLSSLLAIGTLPPLIFGDSLSVLIASWGWSAILSAHSYAVERSRHGSLREAWFFVLVHPALAYTGRGKKTGGIVPGSWKRITLGLLLCALHASCYGALHRLPWSTLEGPARVAGWFAYLAGWTLVVYWAHSGMASFQIGVMGLLGWRIPERYVQPYLASSPPDFWRRWNRYVGEWAFRHVYLPLALRGCRRWRYRKEAVQGAAVVVSFAAIGVLHDLSLSMQQGRLVPPVLLAVFTIQGVAVLAWRRWERLQSAPHNWARRAVYLGLVVGTAATLLPVLAGEPFGSPVLP